MEQQQHEPQSTLPTIRHDGWTGERMATFLQVLADTGLIVEGCRAAGMDRSGFYPLCNRDPVFAAAVKAAKTLARPQVADGLLERSIAGTVEHYYRDGVLVGERRHYESWLGLAVLKRLDKQAEEDRAEQNLSARIARDWRETLDAMRKGGSAAVPAMLEAKVDEVDIPPPPASDPFENCWRSGSADDRQGGEERGLPAGTWITTFPPPAGFDGYENVPWDGDTWYERACTPKEAALLDAHEAALAADELARATAYAEAERDSFFATLRRELETK